MHSKIFCFLFFFCSFVMFGQNIQISKISKAQGGKYIFNKNKQSCITPILRQKIDSVVSNSVRKFRAVHGKQPMTTFFDWPFRKATNSPYFETWAISNFVDHNTAYPDQNTDFNCGTRTYDTANGYNHQGVDIFMWPFSWDQFYNNQAEVVAAAPGTIVFKDDGNFDQSCTFNSNDWNAIYVQHNDGSMALYGHMKANTLTTKNVGDNVQTGEFLGVIGSSGNSTGPHLHFEIFNGAGNLVDPFSGSCNNLNIDSWWNSQKNYREPNINAILTQSAPPVFNPCPQPATINEQSVFGLGETIYLSTYFRDQIAGTQADFTIKTASGTVVSTWTQVFLNTYTVSYWWYTFSVTNSSDALDLIFEVTYNGETKSTPFQVGEGLGTNMYVQQNLQAYPNPFDEKINLTSQIPMKSIAVYDVNGKLILIKNPNEKITTLQTSKLTSGVYFLKMTSKKGKMSLKTMIKE